MTFTLPHFSKLSSELKLVSEWHASFGYDGDYKEEIGVLGMWMARASSSPRRVSRKLPRRQRKGREGILCFQDIIRGVTTTNYPYL